MRYLVAFRVWLQHVAVICDTVAKFKYKLTMSSFLIIQKFRSI